MSLKIERYTSNPNPLEANFKKLEHSLIYDEVIEKGLITRELYYADEGKTDLVIEVVISYESGLDKLIRKMSFEIMHYTEEGKIGASVSKAKILTDRQKLSLLKKKRKTIRESAEAAVMTFLMSSKYGNTVEDIFKIGASFLIKHNQALDFYEKVGSPQIIADVAVSNEEWLDLTPELLQGASIKQYLMGVFSE